MNDALRDLFGHHLWANTTLVEACRVLTDEQLTSPGAAAYGTISETLNHFIGSDAHYLRQLGGEPPAWIEMRADVDLDGLAQRVDDVAAAWGTFLDAGEFDAQRELVLPEDDGGVYRTHAGIVLAQVFMHGTLHREQVCAMLTALGIEPPDLQPWAYADTAGLGTFTAE